MGYELLDAIDSPEAVKRLSVDQLPALANEIRDFMVTAVEETGGHLASNLGAVELTIALVYVYNFPQDKIIWDVGHQSYVYKILTGRKARLDLLRSFGGLSGFPDRSESRYDVFNTGHASTSLSAAAGFLRARELTKGVHSVVSVIGDGALTGGMAWEALNDVGASKLPITIVLNDNEMSIDHNVGSLTKQLSKMRLSKGYAKFKLRVTRVTKCIPPLYRMLKRMRDGFKQRIIHDKIFEHFGITYVGPVNGHDIISLIQYFQLIKEYKEPVILHVLTRKGRGYEKAENDPTFYHGLPPAHSVAYPSFSKKLGSVLTELADRNRNVVAVTAAMTYGTGLSIFAEKHPERLFDVGIAEEHAVTMAAGMAAGGLKPYVAIYSTFLQRAYDQMLHDVCLMNLPVVFCVDRAGVSNGDGATHHGVYDVGYLTTMPNMTVYAPKNLTDFEKALRFAAGYNQPFAIRYPKDCMIESEDEDTFINETLFEIGKWEILQPIADITIVTYGDRMLDLAFKASCGQKIGIVNAAFLNPVDTQMLNVLQDVKKVIILEDAVADCGLYAIIKRYFASNASTDLISMGLPNRPLPFGDNKDIFRSCGITEDELKRLLKE